MSGESDDVHAAGGKSGHHGGGSADWLFRTTLTGVVVLYLAHFVVGESPAWLAGLAHSVHSLVNTMWWGIALGVIMIAVLNRVPRDFVMAALGTGRGTPGILRAVVAGTLLDLCSHGVLMVGAKLYERGATIGQVVAFLLSSPWNSFSLTLVLIALVGLFWTAAFIVLSMVVAVITGLVFDRLVTGRVLPENPLLAGSQESFRFWPEARKGLKEVRLTPGYLLHMMRDGLGESRMVMKWILVGVLLASVLRVLLSPDQFGDWFGPTLAGLGATLFLATILEVCSEGTSPVAADILNRSLTHPEMRLRS